MPTPASANPPRISQRQLAELAQVSRTTVTRALANDPRISAHVTRRIRKLALEHGYRPNAAARSIATQRTNCLGVVLCDRELGHANYGRLIAGVERVTRAAGMRLQLSLCDSGQLAEDELPPIFREVGVDGVVLLGAVTPALLARLEHWMMPVVLMGTTPSSAGVDQVTTDPSTAADCAITHLRQLGHEHIGMLVGPRQRAVHQAYAQGFLTALQAAGLDAQRGAQHIIECATHDVIAALDELLTRAPELTAIFCDTDQAAWHARQCLRARGLTVPGDFSVVGVGGGRHEAHWPLTLTSVDVGLDELAQSAVEMLIAAVRQPRPGCRRVVVQARLVTGDTAGPPNSVKQVGPQLSSFEETRT